MLSSSQVEYIEEALKAGKRVRRFTDAVFKVEYPSGLSPILMMHTGLAVSADDVEACDVLIGDVLSTLRPR